MTQSDATEPVLLQAREQMSVITFNRPERMNAITPDMRYSIVDRLREADRDPATRVIVVTGAGRAFCAGGDVKAMGSDNAFSGHGAGRTPVLSYGRDLVDAFIRADKPIISMVNGPAIGLGATMALLGTSSSWPRPRRSPTATSMSASSRAMAAASSGPS
jgi:enoyl-CoA hydratase